MAAANNENKSFRYGTYTYLSTVTIRPLDCIVAISPPNYFYFIYHTLGFFEPIPNTIRGFGGKAPASVQVT